MFCSKKWSDRQLQLTPLWFPFYTARQYYHSANIWQSHYCQLFLRDQVDQVIWASSLSTTSKLSNNELTTVQTFFLLSLFLQVTDSTDLWKCFLSTLYSSPISFESPTSHLRLLHLQTHFGNYFLKETVNLPLFCSFCRTYLYLPAWSNLDDKYSTHSSVCRMRM